jgi:hypothetical protein
MKPDGIAGKNCQDQVAIVGHQRQHEENIEPLGYSVHGGSPPVLPSGTGRPTP